jgi:serine-type D-Ala-D-Ala carboxypeptidase (penicillin-binding protein 5/6)
MIKRIAAIVGLLLVFGATGTVAVAIWPEQTDEQASELPSTAATQPTPDSVAVDGTSGNSAPPVGGRRSGPPTDIGTAPPLDPRFALQPVTGPLPVEYRFKHPPAAGILFDVKSGEVLWERHPTLKHQIASLTKMMTALLVAQGDSPKERVMISGKAAYTPGSATGLLPKGRKVPLEPLLQALIMISANDAAVALAEHEAGTVPRFVKAMNRQAVAMGLTCTRFSTPNGLRDRANYSCARDLAVLARADLANPSIAEIAQTRYAKPRFPIKGKRLYLSNNHYFLQRGITGLPQAQVTGLKTGFTDAAGRCYVTTAKVGGRQLGAIVLDSPNPLMQVPALLRAGFQELGLVPPLPPKPPAPPPPGA